MLEHNRISPRNGDVLFRGYDADGKTVDAPLSIYMLVVTASPARTALKISQLTDGDIPPTYDSMH